MVEDQFDEESSDAVSDSRAQGASDKAGPSPEREGEAAPTFRGTGVSAGLVVGLLLAILAIIVAFQNTDDVNIDFLAWEVEAPLVVIIVGAVVAGVLLDEIFGFVWRVRRRRQLGERAELRRLRRSS